MYFRYTIFALAALVVFYISCTENNSSELNPSENSRSSEAKNVKLIENLPPGERLLEEATQFATNAQLDSTLTYLEKAASIFKAEKDWEAYTGCLNKMGKYSIEKVNYKIAEQYLDSALFIGKRGLGDQHLLIADNYHHRSLLYRRTGKYDLAEESAQKAIQLKQNKLGNQHISLATSYTSLGSLCRIKGKFDQSIEYHQLALAIYEKEEGRNSPKVTEAYSGLAGGYWSKGEIDKALDYALKNLHITNAVFGKNHNKAAMAYNNVGILYADKGDYDRSLEYFQKSLSTRLALFGEKHPDVATSYHNIAKIYAFIGDNDRAIENSEYGLSIRRSLYGEIHPEVAWEYNGLATHFARIGNYEKGLELVQKALSIWKKTVGEQNPYIGYAYQNVGRYNTIRENYDDAVVALNKAFAIFQATYGNQNIETWKAYLELALLYQKKGEYNTAIQYCESALPNFRAALGNRHPEVAGVYNRMAEIYYAKADYWQSINAFQKAIHANTSSFDDMDPYHNPSLNDIISESLMLSSLRKKAAAFGKYHQNVSNNVADLKASVEGYHHAIQLIDKMRGSFRTENSKLLLSEETFDIYEEAIQNAQRLYRLDKTAEDMETAFLFAQKSKIGILLESLSEAEAKQFSGIPDSILAMEKQLRIDLSYYDKKLSEEKLKDARADSVKLTSLQKNIISQKQLYDDLLSKMEQSYPDYYALKYQVKTASVKEIQEKVVDTGITLIEYSIAKDSIFTFVISKDEFHVTVTPKLPNLENDIYDLRTAIITQNDHAYAETAYRLYQSLLLSIAGTLKTKQLIIIPDGLLNYIPFEALLTEEIPQGTLSVKDYKSLPYLIKKYAISYTYSATLLYETINRQQREANKEYLAYAPVFSDGISGSTRAMEFLKANATADSTRNFDISHLPATRAEALNIENLFVEKTGFFQRLFGASTAVFLEKEANEENLKSRDIEDYRYVHIATHGFINETNPKLSGLIFAQDTTLSEDGILHLGEIYNLNLNADLVVLSACETGLGQIAKGEGLIGLTRGFLYAGAKNLLVSLWQINDVSTANLMVEFYRKMLSGQNKAVALREAKVMLMEQNPKYAKPYYWASFVLIGQ